MESFGGSLEGLGGVDAELLDAEGPRVQGMEFLVRPPAVVGWLAFRFIGRKVFVASVAVFVVIPGRCASWFVRSDEGLAAVFALRSDYSLPDLADRLLELSDLSEEAIKSLQLL